MRDPMTEEQQRLCIKYIPLARSLAKAFRKHWPHEAEEFESAALEALVQAAQSYDPTMNVKFPTFSRYRICGALKDVQRRFIIKGWQGAPEDMPSVSSLYVNAEEFGHVLTATEDAPVEFLLASRDYVEGLANKLPKSLGDVIRVIYIDERTQGQAAKILGYSKSRISYLHREAIEELQYLLQEPRIAC